MIKVANFHDVYDASWLEEVLGFLKKKYKLISIDELKSFISGANYIGNYCHITIDDGDRTFYEVMYPVLKKHNIPATLFVSPKIIAEGVSYWFQEVLQFDQKCFKQIIADYLHLDARRFHRYNIMHICKTMKISQINDVIEYYRMQYNHESGIHQNISLDQLKEIYKDSLIRIGAHTLTHPILANEDESVSEYEIVESLRELSDILGSEIATLVSEQKPAGTYEVKFDASALTSGVYVYRLSSSSEAGDFSQAKKLTLIK